MPTQAPHVSEFQFEESLRNGSVVLTDTPDKGVIGAYIHHPHDLRCSRYSAPHEKASCSLFDLPEPEPIQSFPPVPDPETLTADQINFTTPEQRALYEDTARADGYHLKKKTQTGGASGTGVGISGTGAGSTS